MILGSISAQRSAMNALDGEVDAHHCIGEHPTAVVDLLIASAPIDVAAPEARHANRSRPAR